MKNMYRKYLIFLIVVMSICTVQAREVVVLDENVLKKYINDEVPSIESINTYYEQSLQEKISFDEYYIFSLNGSVMYQKFRDKGRHSIYGKTKSVNINLNEVGLNKKFINGTELSVITNYGQSKKYDSNNSYNRENNANVFMQFSINLWKDFLGYSQLAKKASIDYGINEARIKKNIEVNLFFINLRKIYWNLIANEQMISIYNELIKQSEKDLENTKQRFESYVADKGDVAKSNANLNSRKASLEDLKVKRQEIIQQLSYLLPNLNDKDIIIKSKNFKSVLNSLNNCLVNSEKIDNYTLYSDYINEVSNKLDAEIKSLRRYNGPDVNLILGANIVGEDDNEFFKAYEDIGNINSTYYTAGISFSMPLGKTKENLKLQRTKILKMEHNSTINSIKSNIRSVHNNFAKSMNYLNNQLKELKNNVYNLDVFVENIKTKYKQGRVPLKDVIEEEDKLLQAKLDIINIENSMINLTLNYLSVFQKAECNFNINLSK